MHKVFLALTLLSVPVSTGALAHSGTDQEEKACARDVHHFLPQGDRSGRLYYSGLPQGESCKALSHVSLCAGQPRAIANVTHRPSIAEIIQRAMSLEARKSSATR
jgi:hypothetical protein